MAEAQHDDATRPGTPARSPTTRPTTTATTTGTTTTHMPRSRSGRSTARRGAPVSSGSCSGWPSPSPSCSRRCRPTDLVVACTGDHRRTVRRAMLVGHPMHALTAETRESASNASLERSSDDRVAHARRTWTTRSEQPDDVPVRVDVDVLAARHRRQPGHRPHLAAQRRDEPAPADSRISRIGTVKPAGRPLRFASWLSEYWVLAMQTGRCPKPSDSYSFSDFWAAGVRSMPSAP